MRAMPLVPALCWLKLSKLGLVMTAVGQALSPGKQKWALLPIFFFASPATSTTGTVNAQTLSVLSFASVSG